MSEAHWQQAKKQMFHLSRKSRNTKTGPIPVSTSSEATCPDSCPLKDEGCFGKPNGSFSTPLGWHWDKVSNGDRGLSLSEFTSKIAALPFGQLWRGNQVGDLPGEGDRICHESIAAFIAANYGKRGFTYTHKPVLAGPEAAGNREAIDVANKFGFAVNLSANNISEADQLADLGIAPVCTLLPEGVTRSTRTPAGRPVRRCPAEYLEEVNCSNCGICSRPKRSYIVGFTPFGKGSKAAKEVANV